MKQQYRYEYQLASIMYDNYGISLEEFTKLVHEQYNAVTYHDITTTYERISEQKIYCVVETDNFGGDYPDESFVAWIDSKGMHNPYHFDKKDVAEGVATAFNAIDSSKNSSRYYKVVEKNYKLLGPFEP